MLANAFDTVIKTIQFMRVQDYIDILIVAFVIYKGIKLIHETRTEQLLRGIVVIVVALQVSSWLKLNMINFILRNTMQVGFIALFIVFQPELRRGLEKMGRSKFGSFLKFEAPEENEEQTIKEITEAVRVLQEKRIGALIVIERASKIGDIVRTGVVLNSRVTSQLLISIFTPSTPLHDGAVIVRDNKVIAASCFLPLTQNDELSTELGTRHRAALGISETSDAVVVVVSEETGKISIAMEGALTRNLTCESLARALTKLISPPKEEKPKLKLKLFGGAKK